MFVCLCRNQTHAHVLPKLEAYTHLMNLGNYYVVFDTMIENVHDDMFGDRP
ncbi:CmcI family methyltransferase [Pseudanabaena mucicola]|uniref:CmcI family methyltransferase n=1 Tax=Pseudanabaena mucicola TaxID=71190 RepID=UPI003306CA27